MLKVFYLTVLFFIILNLHRLVSSFIRKEEYTHASFKHICTNTYFQISRFS